MSIKEKAATFLSKKLFVFIVTSILVPVLAAKGVPAETINWLLGLAGITVGGISTIDAVSAYRK